MSSQKSLLRSVSIRESGKMHQCRSNKRHLLSKGKIMLVVKEGQDERHYCADCGLKFVTTARKNLDDIELRLRA